METFPGNKLGEGEENPIDVWVLALTRRFLPLFHATGHTPNILTAYSFALGLLSLRFLERGSMGLFVVAYLLSYFFDCIDGQFARTYDMVTRFGDFFDHFTDLLLDVGLLVVVFFRYREILPQHTGLIVLKFVLLLLAGTHLSKVLGLSPRSSHGCQQKKKASTQDATTESIDIFVQMCPAGDQWIGWTRYFGAGTHVLFNVLAVLILENALTKRRRTDGPPSPTEGKEEAPRGAE